MNTDPNTDTRTRKTRRNREGRERNLIQACNA
jgi:hypothetical protein